MPLLKKSVHRKGEEIGLNIIKYKTYLNTEPKTEFEESQRSKKPSMTAQDNKSQQ